MFMCFLIYFIVYSTYSDVIYEFMYLMYLIHRMFGSFLHSLCIWSVVVLYMWVRIHVHVSIKTLRVGRGSKYAHASNFYTC